VGTVMISVFHLFLMERFGKTSFGQKFLTIAPPFVYLAVVNYSSSTELVDEEDIDEEEIKRALKIPNLEILGINNRNLNTFEVDIKTTEKLINEILYYR